MQTQTYNDAQVSEKSRETFMTALKLMDEELAKSPGYNTEKLEALANVASAASNGFSEGDAEEPESFG